MKTNKVYHKKCKKCDSEYDTPSRSSRLCPTCRRQNRLDYMKRYNEKRSNARKLKNGGRGGRNMGTRYKTTISASRLSSAKTQPPSCSDVRWRIELRRRTRAEYYRDFGCDCK